MRIGVVLSTVYTVYSRCTVSLNSVSFLRQTSFFSQCSSLLQVAAELDNGASLSPLQNRWLFNVCALAALNFSFRKSVSKLKLKNFFLALETVQNGLY